MRTVLSGVARFPIFAPFALQERFEGGTRPRRPQYAKLKRFPTTLSFAQRLLTSFYKCGTNEAMDHSTLR